MREGAISGTPIQTYSTATRQFLRVIPALHYRPQWLPRHQVEAASVLPGRGRSTQDASGSKLRRGGRGGTCVRGVQEDREGEGNVAAARPSHSTSDLHNDALVHSQVKKIKSLRHTLTGNLSVCNCYCSLCVTNGDTT